MKRILCVFLLFLYGVSIASCEKAPKKYTAQSFDYFDTVTSILGYEESKSDFDSVCQEIFESLSYYHKLFTIYESYEDMHNLFSVNELQDGAHQTVKVDAALIEFLLYAKEVYEKTDGKVNIAMGSMLSIWHEYRANAMTDPSTAEIPPMEKLTAASEHTNIEHLLIDQKNGTVTLTDPEMLLDVGAVAKGYAVEMIASSLEKKGITGYVINVGGNVRTIGTKTGGEKWIVGIENPLETDGSPYSALLALADESLVTSGSYQRYYEVAGQKYHHIIDPDTLMPAEGYMSVSVVCKSSADADALTTALFCMTYEQGNEFVESLPNTEAMWILADGRMFFSSGFSDYRIDHNVMDGD